MAILIPLKLKHRNPVRRNCKTATNVKYPEEGNWVACIGLSSKRACNKRTGNSHGSVRDPLKKSLAPPRHAYLGDISR